MNLFPIKTTTLMRQLNWISSLEGDPPLLHNLEQRMREFYSQGRFRQSYQEMLETIDETPLPGSVGEAVVEYIHTHSNTNTALLEVGCGSGRFYRQLQKRGFAGKYTGIEMADYVIVANRRQYPEATWQVRNIYDLSLPDESFDLCLLFYVLEHMVYPERALHEAMRILKQGSKLILVFPDFVATGQLPSQQTGLSVGPARQKLLAGRWWDALITLYDSRVRVKSAIRAIKHCVGPFPVNIKPVCLSPDVPMSPDIDAIYIASKSEISNWATSRGYSVEYPRGIAGQFHLHSYLVITK